jgi:hypothetical protein
VLLKKIIADIQNEKLGPSAHELEWASLIRKGATTLHVISQSGVQVYNKPIFPGVMINCILVVKHFTCKDTGEKFISSLHINGALHSPSVRSYFLENGHYDEINWREFLEPRYTHLKLDRYEIIGGNALTHPKLLSRIDSLKDFIPEEEDYVDVTRTRVDIKDAYFQGRFCVIVKPDKPNDYCTLSETESLTRTSGRLYSDGKFLKN